MKVFEIQQGFGLSNLKMVERAEPRVGPGQVLLKMEAASLNYRDLMMVKGVYNPRQKLPLVPLSDGVGRVQAVGEGTTRVSVGDRVAGIFAQKWLTGSLSADGRASTLGGPLDGALAERMVLDEDGVVVVPDYLSAEEAATLPCAAVTAWHALLSHQPIQAGDTVLIQGTGGVSLFALQFARMAGARAILVSRSEEKIERAQALGPLACIDTRKEPRWVERVLELTGGAGVDRVVEVVGGKDLAKSIQVVRFGGSVQVIGILDGVSAELPLTSLLMKCVRLQGIFVGPREMFERMNRALAAQQLRPVVDRVFPFANAPEAFAHLEAARHVGKVVIRF